MSGTRASSRKTSRRSWSPTSSAARRSHGSFTPPASRARTRRKTQSSMRLSKSLVPTLREDPADAEALSHKLMLRAGLVRQLAAGIYVWLPLGQRVLDRVNAIIREEMNAIGGQEMTMPVLH